MVASPTDDMLARHHDPFPSLTDTQRKEREGIATLAVTPEILPYLAPVLTTRYLWPRYFGIAAGVYLVAIIVLAVFLSTETLALVPLLLVPLYFAYAHLMRARQAAVANRAQSYVQYAGQCEITGRSQTYNSGAVVYSYVLHVPSPPAPARFTALQLGSDGRQRQELPGVAWRTVEIAGSDNAVRIFRIRDERDQVIYP